ncbi:MAG: hypothetical protein ACREP9_06025 [Candidatus Dormibacteraceae bacterium]
MTTNPITGIPDPDGSGRWLVRPWPREASFCEITRHFLTAYIWRLQNDTNVARQLAYFQGYHTALQAAPTHELKHDCDWQWRNDLQNCVARCVASYQGKYVAQVQNRTNVRTLTPSAPTTIPTPLHRKRAS